ncbi:hypothetical protein PQO03_19255 [Lentisphaera profundi]|uniref:2'-5' RNA ligase n=1 Tax=Lentisphaera profundi TaxID=1658616 RepID=A0ABY7VUS6_9BACT|nr:hypothetical protein [Lentisphaera profundi]WDE97968.1 hypothetical protein PQO03_19255 [Lentisphaera profundi]
MGYSEKFRFAQISVVKFKMPSIRTDVLVDRDYREWHGGIALYGFWCVQIEDSSWIDRLNCVKSSFKPFLQDGYQRFPHVTIATVGLMNDENWRVANRQIKLLRMLKLSKIGLSWKAVSSYIHSPIVRVSSSKNYLSKIREQLHLISLGDDSSDFDPHITLGYYSSITSIDSTLMTGEESCVQKFDSLEIGEIKFCTYETHTIKGSLSVQSSIDLRG